MNIPSDLRAALLAELDKALPRLLKRAQARLVTERKAATKREAGGRRAPKGAARAAILMAIWAADDGRTWRDILRVSPHYTKGPALNEHTLKKWLVLLKEADEIETRNGKWYPVGASALGRAKTRIQPASRSGFTHAPLQVVAYPKNTGEK